MRIVLSPMLFNNFPKKCRFVMFASHTSKHLHKDCGQVFLKDFKSISRKQLFMPFKTYCYRSVKESIETLLVCSEWEQGREKWRNRNTGLGLLTDILMEKFEKLLDTKMATCIFRKNEIMGSC